LQSIWVTILSVVLSGVLAMVVNNIWQRIVAKRDRKMEVFKTAVSYRYNMIDETNVQALNSICVIFYDNKKVLKAWDNFVKETNNPPGAPNSTRDKYIKLLEEMARACSYKNINWDDLKADYNPNGVAEKIFEERLLRSNQILALQKQLSNDGNKQSSSERMSQEVQIQLISKLIENPGSLTEIMKLADTTKANSNKK